MPSRIRRAVHQLLLGPFADLVGLYLWPGLSLLGAGSALCRASDVAVAIAGTTTFGNDITTVQVSVHILSSTLRRADRDLSYSVHCVH